MQTDADEQMDGLIVGCGWMNTQLDRNGCGWMDTQLDRNGCVWMDSGRGGMAVDGQMDVGRRQMDG